MVNKGPRHDSVYYDGRLLALRSSPWSQHPGTSSRCT